MGKLHLLHLKRLRLSLCLSPGPLQPVQMVRSPYPSGEGQKIRVSPEADCIRIKYASPVCTAWPTLHRSSWEPFPLPLCFTLPLKFQQDAAACSNLEQGTRGEQLTENCSCAQAVLSLLRVLPALLRTCTQPLPYLCSPLPTHKPRLLGA